MSRSVETMANSQRPIVLMHLRKLMAAQCPTQQSDMQLLQQFIGDRDETTPSRRL